MRRTAVITGVSGQDGSYLAEHLLQQGYRVIGTTRSLAGGGEHHRWVPRGVEMTEFEARTLEAARALVAEYRPDEIYNCAARASSGQLHDDPLLTADVNGLAVVRLLEAIRLEHPPARFCQASSSEVFGNPVTSPQCEKTPFSPRNSYGAAKLYAQNMVANYRTRLGLFAASAILFNHESPRRGAEFITKKVCRAAAEISLNMAESLVVGDLDSRRDWGFAGDYVKAMWLMLQSERPCDYVIASGKTHSVRELCELAFGHVSLDFARYVAEDPAMRRPPEVVQLQGDPSRAERGLGWTRHMGFDELIRMMVDAERAALAGRGGN